MINIVVTTCGEEQTVNLLNLLKNTVDRNFKIWVLKDSTEDSEVYEKIDEINGKNISHIKYPMSGDFSKFRNYVHNFINEGEWILQLDADEMVDKDFIHILPALIDENNNIDLLYLPRNNYVNGITDEYIEDMNWNVDDHGRINYPDWQGRLYKYKDGVRWEGKVHEKVKGIKKYAMLKEDWAHLDHVKNFDRQKRQNEYYKKLEE